MKQQFKSIIVELKDLKHNRDKYTDDLYLEKLQQLHKQVTDHFKNEKIAISNEELIELRKLLSLI